MYGSAYKKAVYRTHPNDAFDTHNSRDCVNVVESVVAQSLVEFEQWLARRSNPDRLLTIPEAVQDEVIVWLRKNGAASAFIERLKLGGFNANLPSLVGNDVRTWFIFDGLRAHCFRVVFEQLFRGELWTVHQLEKRAHYFTRYAHTETDENPAFELAQTIDYVNEHFAHVVTKLDNAEYHGQRGEQARVYPANMVQYGYLRFESLNTLLVQCVHELVRIRRHHAVLTRTTLQSLMQLPVFAITGYMVTNELELFRQLDVDFQRMLELIKKANE